MTDIATVVLAAGSSRRFGDSNKLLARVDGKPVLTYVLDCVASQSLSTKIVVVKPGDEEVTSLIDTRVFDIVENANARDGMGSSISAGIRALGAVDGAFLILGDMPFIKESTYLELLAAFQEHPDKSIFAPLYDQRRGHPVLFRHRYFADLMGLTNDTGAKRILAANEAAFLAVPTTDAGVLSDIDVPADNLRIY